MHRGLTQSIESSIDAFASDFVPTRTFTLSPLHAAELREVKSVEIEKDNSQTRARTPHTVKTDVRASNSAEQSRPSTTPATITRMTSLGRPFSREHLSTSQSDSKKFSEVSEANIDSQENVSNQSCIEISQELKKHARSSIQIAAMNELKKAKVSQAVSSESLGYDEINHSESECDSMVETNYESDAGANENHQKNLEETAPEEKQFKEPFDTTPLSTELQTLVGDNQAETKSYFRTPVSASNPFSHKRKEVVNACYPSKTIAAIEPTQICHQDPSMRALLSGIADTAEYDQYFAKLEEIQDGKVPSETDLKSYFKPSVKAPLVDAAIRSSSYYSFHIHQESNLNLSAETAAPEIKSGNEFENDESVPVISKLLLNGPRRSSIASHENSFRKHGHVSFNIVDAEVEHAPSTRKRSPPPPILNEAPDLTEEQQFSILSNIAEESEEEVNLDPLITSEVDQSIHVASTLYKENAPDEANGKHTTTNAALDDPIIDQIGEV